MKGQGRKAVPKDSKKARGGKAKKDASEGKREAEAEKTLETEIKPLGKKIIVFAHHQVIN